MTNQKTEATPTEPKISFEDENGMFGTSPVTKELTDEEVEFLTRRTAPRVNLTRSFRKIALYISLFLILFFLSRLVYHRTIPVTGFVVPPVFWMGERGLTIVSGLLALINFFLITPEDKSIKWMVRFFGTGIPVLALAALYLLPAKKIHELAYFLF